MGIHFHLRLARRGFVRQEAQMLLDHLRKKAPHKEVHIACFQTEVVLTETELAAADKIGPDEEGGAQPGKLREGKRDSGTPSWAVQRQQNVLKNVLSHREGALVGPGHREQPLSEREERVA